MEANTTRVATAPRKVTFKQLYNEHRRRPTPRQLFIAEVAEITRKSQATVSNWVTGIQSPDLLAREQIAAHFGVDVDSLFPPARQADEKKVVSKKTA